MLMSIFKILSRIYYEKYLSQDSNLNFPISIPRDGRLN